MCHCTVESPLFRIHTEFGQKSPALSVTKLRFSPIVRLQFILGALPEGSEFKEHTLMSKRLLVLVVLVASTSLIGFGADNSSRSKIAQTPSASKSSHAQTTASAQKRGTSDAKTIANWSRHQKSSNPPPTNVGFLGSAQIAAGGGTFSRFPSVMGAFTNSGQIDVATVALMTDGEYAISALLGNGNGTFQPAALTPTTNACYCDPIWVGDMNNDGNADIVMGHRVTGNTPASVEVFLSNGDGTFTSMGITPVTSNPVVWATLADVNGDGNLDVVVADGANPGNIWTLLGNGDGTLQAPTSVSFSGQLAVGTPVSFNPIVFADFNGDGILDFAGAEATTNQITVYLGQAQGTYSAGVPLSTPNSVYDSCFAAGGNLNGQTDIVTANCRDDSFTVYVNSGAGTFQTGVYYPTSAQVPYPGASPVALSIADVNGDGNNDIISTNIQSGDVSVFLGNGDGTVRVPAVGYATGGSPHSPALISDFNGDGKADLLVPDQEFSFVYLQGYGDGTFRSAMDYYALPGDGYEPNGVGIASGDFNGDGIPDIVIGNTNSNPNSGITVFLSNPDGSMQPGVSYFPSGSNYQLEYVVVGDFNGDGILDIAAADFFNGVVQIFTGKGDGTFQVGQTYSTDSVNGANALGLVAGDFNGDGKLDLAVVNNHGTSADVGVLINNGSGGFNSVVNYPLSNLASEITAAALTSSQKLNLIVPLYGTASAPGSAVAIFMGNGDGTFQNESDVQLVNGSTTYNNPFAAAIGDVNGDGKPDLAVTIQDQTTFNQGIAVALGNGDGTFQTPVLLPSTLQNPALDVPLPGFVQMLDLNRDGSLDLIYTNIEFSTVGVIYGKGNGTFFDPVEYPAGRSAFDLALADVNHDGVIDAVTTGNATEFSGVTVLLNNSGAQTTVGSSAPRATLGEAVTFTAGVGASKVRGVTTIPTGSVTFEDGTTVLATVPLSSGQAAYTDTGLTGGTHNITAQYSGDTNYVTNSAVMQQVVGQAGSSAAVASSANPATPGLKVTFTATVASTVTGDPLVPTGKVTFNDGSNVLGSAALNSSGIAVFSTTSLAVGQHSITAQYGGDGNFLSSTSAELKQTVVLPDYELGVSPSKIAVNPGSSAEYSITLTPVNGYDGTVTLSCPASLPSGVTCTLPKPVAMNGQDVKVTLTVNTTGPSAAMFAPGATNPRPGGTGLWAELSGVGLLGIVLAGERKKRSRRAMIVLGVVALAMVLALAGCGSNGQSVAGGGGGGGTGTGGGGGTPAGSYVLPITSHGTAGTNGGNTAPHTLNVTLVVN
jgi:hypothetical protein